VKFTGAVGDDAHGRRILETLSEAHIDVGHVRVLGTAATGTAVIAVDDSGENQIIVSPGANAGLTLDDVVTGLAALTAGDVLVLQLEIPAELVRQAARIAKQAGAFVILNAAPAPRHLDGAGRRPARCPRRGHRLHCRRGGLLHRPRRPPGARARG
jgi:ribokinase